MVEIYFSWSEQVAVMGKGQQGIVKAIENIKQDLPFNKVRNYISQPVGTIVRFLND